MPTVKSSPGFHPLDVIEVENFDLVVAPDHARLMVLIQVAEALKRESTCVGAEAVLSQFSATHGSTGPDRFAGVYRS